MPEIDNEIQRARDAYRATHQQTLELLMKLNELEAENRIAKRLVTKKVLPSLKGSDASELEQLRKAPTGKTERRAIVGELRAKGRRLTGYAATFGAEAKIGNFTETIAPGAFSASLAERDDILALVDHDPGRVLARTKSGTLRLAEDSRGLAFDLDVPATSAGADVLALAERGDIGGASFAFTVKREKWDGERRTLESVDLHEVSVVSAWPAYEGTIVQARARPADIQIAPRLAVARRYLESL